MRVRTAPLVTAVALVLAGGLSACSQAGTAASCAPLLEAGPVSDSIVVLGESGTVPQVSIPESSVPNVSQRTVVQQAESRDKLVNEGDLITVNFGFYNGLSGEQVFATPGFGSDTGGYVLQDASGTDISAFTTAFRCSAVGDRVVVALSPQDSVAFAQGYGVMAGTPIVAVADVQGIAGLSADGKVRSLPSGFPGIAVDENGRPGIVIPPGSQPSEVRSAARVEGTGKTVTAEDSVIAQVLTVDWAHSVIENTWETGPMSIGTETAPAADFRAQLTGYPVGSQVIVMTPGDAGAQVSVVDILSVG